MGIKIVTAPSLEPITLAEAKAQCNVDTTDFDGVLDIFIKSARAAAENYMGAAIMQRSLDMTIDIFPSDADIGFEVAPAWNQQHTVAAPISVTSVTYIDTAGATQTLAGSAYTLDDSFASGSFWLLPAYNTDWPDTREQANAVTVRYQVGYDTTAKVPPSIRGWILMTVALFFAQRESMDLTGKMLAVPSRFVDSLLDPYRVISV
jgi:uncharacterized phiE125 gp8 family phage protein